MHTVDTSGRHKVVFWRVFLLPAGLKFSLNVFYHILSPNFFTKSNRQSKTSRENFIPGGKIYVKNVIYKEKIEYLGKKILTN